MIFSKSFCLNNRAPVGRPWFISCASLNSCSHPWLPPRLIRTGIAGKGNQSDRGLRRLFDLFGPIIISLRFILQNPADRRGQLLIHIFMQSIVLSDDQYLLIDNLCHRGLFLQAYRESQKIGPFESWSGAKERLAANTLIINLGGFIRSDWLLRGLWKTSPDNSRVRFRYAYYLLRRRSPFEIWHWMQAHELPGDNDAEVYSDWLSLKGTISSVFRDYDAAEAYSAEAVKVAPRECLGLRVPISYFGEPGSLCRSAGNRPAGLGNAPWIDRGGGKPVELANAGGPRRGGLGVFSAGPTSNWNRFEWWACFMPCNGS